jgi:hypothetical protein
MNYKALTSGSLTLMYEAVRGALASDDAQEQRGEDPRFRVRETPDWRKHAADLEGEMLRRGMPFQRNRMARRPGEADVRIMKGPQAFSRCDLPGSK